MKEYPNFYENIVEAERRLRATIVLYDGEPYYVLCISDHHSDGIFRVYLDKIGHPQGLACNRYHVPYEEHHSDEEDRPTYELMDEFLEDNPDVGIIRKHINSPKFNKFRPFPLGMCNIDGQVYYLSRRPTRPNTQQGLLPNTIKGELVTLTPNDGPTRSFHQVYGREFKETVLGVYPDIDDIILNYKNDVIVNQGVAFSRDFAIMKGPLSTLFLAYKSDIIGYLPRRDRSLLHLSPEFYYVKDVISDMKLFEDIQSYEGVL